MLIIGCDPGNKGAIALVTRDSVAVWDMPTLKTKRGKKVRERIDLHALWSLAQSLAVLSPAAVVIENVSAMPGDGKAGIYTFGHGAGALEMAFVAAGVPILSVAPAKWIRDLGLIGQGKDAVRAYIKRAYPGHAELFARVKDEGRSDAAAIGLWALIHAPSLQRVH